MPLKIAPEDRKVAILLAVLITFAFGLVIFMAQTDSGSGSTPSSYSSGNSGTKAAYLLLEQTGYAPKRWTSDPRKLAEVAPNATLILADPEVSEQADIESVRNFIRKGGRVVTTGVGASIFFPFKRMQPGMPHFRWKSYKPVEPSDLTRGIQEIELATQFYFREADGEIPFRDEEERPVLRFHYGAGEVIWWSSADPMTNAAIREKDNAQLLLNSIGEPGRGPVLWDEYFHEGTKTVVDSILASPLRWGLLQAALIGCVVCLTFSRRFGPVRDSVATSRLAPMEFVETLAALYERSGASQISVEIVNARFRAALHRRFSIALDAPPHVVAARIVEHAPSLDQDLVRKTLNDIANVESGPRIPMKRATAIVRQLHQWSSQLKLKLGGE
jgi:Domain of unknown function (DUF4350)